MGDSSNANRVLHVAVRGNQLLGCCSSTVRASWTGPDCGHWGLLVVAPAVQGSGIGSILVADAEQRLQASGCLAVQIEYSYEGDAYSDRLLQWYEGKCGFRSSAGRPQAGQFRRCRKLLSDPDEQYKFNHHKSLLEP